MIQQVEVVDMDNKTKVYFHSDLPVEINLPETKSISVKVTEEQEYIDLCALCDREGVDKMNIQLIEPTF